MNDNYYDKFNSLPISNQLKFSVCPPKTKAPFKEKWNEDDNLLSLEQLKESFNKNSNQNWGVMGGRGILIIDIDSELTDDNKLYNALKHLFKQTLLTKTSKGLHAIYYYTDDIPSLHIELKDNNKILGEFRNSYKQHTIEAGSIHPNGLKYTLMQDNEIALFDLKDYEQLINLFVDNPKEIQKETKRIKKKEKNNSNKQLQLTNNVKVTLNDVCELIGAKESDFKKKKDAEYGVYYEWRGFLKGHEKEAGEIYNNTVKYFVNDGHVAWNCFVHPTQDESKRNWETLKAMINGVCTCEETASFDDDIKSKIQIANKDDFISKAVETTQNSKFKNIDNIIKDPLHDLLLKYNLYTKIMKEIESTGYRSPSEYESFILSIFDNMNNNVPYLIVDELMKYSELMRNDYFIKNDKSNYTISYYNIINKFIYDIANSKYNDFLDIYDKVEYSINDINFNIVYEYLNKNNYNIDYQMNLKKWMSSVNKDFNLFRFDDILNSEDKQEFIIENFLVDDGVSLISADKGAGKTFFAMDLQISIAIGRDFMGLKTKKCPVMFVDFENGKNVMNPRYKGLFNGYNLNEDEMSDLRDNLLLEIKKSGWGFVYRDGNELKINEANLNELLNICIERNVKLIMFDPLVNIGQFQETNEDYTYLKNKIFDRFIQKGIAVLLLHHLTKGSDKNGKKSARGGGALEGFVVTSYHLQIEKYDLNGNAKRNTLLKNKGRNGEINTFTYDIDIKDKSNDDNTKEYEFIKLSKVEKVNGLSPEQISVLEEMQKKDYYTTQEFLCLLFDNGLINETSRNVDGGFKSNLLNSHMPGQIRQLMPYIDRIPQESHDYRIDNDKKVRGNVYKLKQQKLNESLGGDDNE